MSSTQPTVVSALVRFDHRTGPIVQCHYPENIPNSLLSQLPAYALPDAIHKQNLDFVYFTISTEDVSEGCFLGISCFKQCQSDLERGYLQRAMIIALFQPSSNPLNQSAFTTMQSALSRPARLLFEREPSDDDCTGILKTLHEDASIALNVSRSTHHHSNVVFMSSLSKLVAVCPEQLLVLIKALNAGAQIVIYSQASLHHLTSTVLALTSFCSGPTVVMPYVPVQYFDDCLQRNKHALIGCNNAVLWNRAQTHVSFDIDELDLRIEQGVWTDVLRLTRADRRFAAALKPSDEESNIVSMYRDYQRRAIRSTKCHLEAEKNNPNQTLDDALRDFNTSWAGIMFGFTKSLDNEDSISDQERTHPYHDDDDGDDVFGESTSLNSIINSISEQTMAIGDQAQRTFWEASSRISSWVGSLAQAESEEPEPEELPRPHSVWTD